MKQSKLLDRLTGAEEMKIEDWRREIDEIDNELLRLLNRRAQAAIQVGALKRKANLPVYDQDREHEVLSRLCTSNAGPLDGQAVAKLFRRIICESRRIETQTIEDLAALESAGGV